MTIKINDIKAISALPLNDAIRALKPKKKKELIGIINCVVEKAEKGDDRLWAVANRALSELYLRKIEKPELKDLQKKIEKTSGTRCVDITYALEAAGIQKGEKILRPYPRSRTAKKVFERWEKSSSESFDSFYKEKVSKHDKKILEKSKVHYLKKEERKKYEVTFKDKKILIGGKTPTDGEYIFALDAKGEKLLAGRKEKGVLQHSSFFSGKAVQSSGIFDLHKKRISAIRLSSGHYKPTLEKDGKSLKEFLESDSRLGKSEVKRLPILAH